MDPSKTITNEVNEYKEQSNDFLDDIKKIVFYSLIAKIGYDTFKNKIDKKFNTYTKKMNKQCSSGYSNISNIITLLNNKNVVEGVKTPLKLNLEHLIKEINDKDMISAQDKFYKVVNNYYKTSIKTLDKEYVNEVAYLKKKMTQYDKVEKVVPYFRKDGIAYYDISTYNSMVYNTNLTKEAWNSTYRSAMSLGKDLCYMQPHACACPYCQEYQGKWYSLTGNSLIYPPLSDVADEFGTMHPNCKHCITLYSDGKENIYSNEENIEGYEALQKINSLKLTKKRLQTDMEIYQKLGDQEMVDKTKSKIKILNSSIKEENKKVVR